MDMDVLRINGTLHTTIQTYEQNYMQNIHCMLAHQWYAPYDYSDTHVPDTACTPTVSPPTATLPGASLRITRWGKLRPVTHEPTARKPDLAWQSTTSERRASTGFYAPCREHS